MPWNNPMLWVCIAVVAVVGIGVGALIGILYRKKVAERLIGSAEQKAKLIVEEGEKQAASAQKEAMLSAKEDIMRQRNDFEREMKERRNEVSRTESRLAKKEETLEKKTEQVEAKSEQLDKKIKENEQFRELIAEQLKSVKGDASLSINGAELKLLSGTHKAVHLSNLFADVDNALPILYMTDFADGVSTSSAELTPHNIKIGGTSMQPIFEMNTQSGYAELSLNGEAYKKLEWKNNGDGTCSLIGR